MNAKLETQPVYFNARSAERGDEPLGHAKDAKGATAILRKELLTWHGYASPPPLLIEVAEKDNYFVGVWRERRYQPTTGAAELTSHIF